jgi:hypothetical protein
MACRRACKHPGNVPAATLSNDVHMPDADVSSSATKTPRSEGGVLANLPRTRPQRSSARRAAARGASPAAPAAPRKTTRAKPTKPTASKRTAARSKSQPKRRVTEKRAVEAVTESESSASAAAKASPATPRPSSAVRAKRARAAKRAAPPRPTAPLQEPAPRQGFESEGETDGAVAPPGGAELVSAAAEIVGELAKAGLSTGERLLKDVFSRLPLS